MEKRIQEIWQGWKVVKKLGTGGFGAVYEIERELFGKTERAAIKVISIPKENDEIEELYNEGYDEESVAAHYKSFLEDIVKEYSLMFDMKGHTNIVYCDDMKYIEHKDGIGWDIFIKMELLTPLTKLALDSFSETEVIKLGVDICRALVVCKSQNVIHRDIKPQNIFVSRTGDYKLGDFGIAKVSERTQSGTAIGTLGYMPPEVGLGKPYGVAADIYSLGLVLYWLLNNKKLPFLPAGAQVPTAEQKSAANLRRMGGEELPDPVHGSDELKKIVRKACEFKPENRYSSANEMLKALSKLLPDEDEVVAVTQPSEPEITDIDNDKTVSIFTAPTQPEISKKEEAAEAISEKEYTPVIETPAENPIDIPDSLANAPLDETVAIFADTAKETTKEKAKEHEGSEKTEVLKKEEPKEGPKPEPKKENKVDYKEFVQSGESNDKKKNKKPKKKGRIKKIILTTLGVVVFSAIAFYIYLITNMFDYTLLPDGTYCVYANKVFGEKVIRILDPEEIEIPATHKGKPVTVIGEVGFASCNSLEYVYIPNTVKEIRAGAFRGCWNADMNIPDSVETIGEGAFFYTDITHISIPDSVTSIGENAFEPDNLEYITVSPNNKVYHSEGNCLIETKTKKLVFGCKSSNIPNDGSVTVIGKGAFSSCRGLESIVIPDTVVEIDDYAFQNCYSLTRIEIPDSVTRIGNWAFEDCGYLKFLTIGDRVETIGCWAFANCYSLETIEIPKSVTHIYEGAFYTWTPDTGRVYFEDGQSVWDVFDSNGNKEVNGIITPDAYQLRDEYHKYIFKKRT